MHNDDEWGNLGDFDATDAYANIRANNKSRKGSKEWKKVIDSRKQPEITDEERKRRSKTKTELNNTPEFKAIMKEVYKSEKFLQACLEANQDPERNRKISEAHSNYIKTPDGVFSFNEAREKYNMTGTGLRYRAETQDGWEMVKEKQFSDERRQQLSESAKATAEIRQKAIAEKKGYVFTPLGKFYTVRQAWLHHKEQGDNEALAQQQYGGWFRKMCKLQPDNYYKEKKNESKNTN